MRYARKETSCYTKRSVNVKKTFKHLIQGKSIHAKTDKQSVYDPGTTGTMEHKAGQESDAGPLYEYGVAALQ